MIISILECEQWEKEYFQTHLGDHTLQFIDAPIENGVPGNTEVLVVFIYSQVTSDIVSSLPNLKLVCTRSTGFDHIDVSACSKKNIPVCTVPFYGENTVAEHAFALLLAISRQVVPGVLRVRAGSFDPHGLQGFDLKGKTVGVIGSGHIGQHFIRMALGFQMDVLAYDPFPKDGLAESLGFSYVALDDLLARSDVITLHCPYNEHTHHLLNADNLAQIKPGCVVINTSRGGLIDSQALYDALVDGRVSACGLDVLEEESHLREEAQILSTSYRQSVDLHALLVDHALILHPNVLVTPHNAFNSKEALMRILQTTVENIRLAGSQNAVGTVK